MYYLLVPVFMFAFILSYTSFFGEPERSVASYNRHAEELPKKHASREDYDSNEAVGAGEIPEDVTAYGWKLTFHDDFEDYYDITPNGTVINKGKKDAPPSHCFSLTPQCMKWSWVQKDCDPKYHKQLEDLNKCNWRVFDYYNWMDFDLPEGEGINALHPSQVKVKNGKLILYAAQNKALRRPGSTALDRSKIDCKRKHVNPEITSWPIHSNDCPILSGAVQSNPHSNDGFEVGFAQEYGRFEVLAKLPDGPGTWPAHWLLPSIEPDEDSRGHHCGWPVSGEIDVMEMWSDNKGKKYKGGLFSGDCEKRIQQSSIGGWHKDDTIATGFNRYIAEWTPNYVRFIFNDIVVATVYNGQEVKSAFYKNKSIEFTDEEVKERFKYPIKIPKHPFYWILNTSIYKPNKEKYRPNIDNFKTTEHQIEHVKVWKRCTRRDYNNPYVKCEKFKDKDTQYNYNTHKKETAVVEMNAYPVPVRRGSPLNIRITPEQECVKSSIQMYSIQGKVMPVQVSGDFYSNGAALHTGHLDQKIYYGQIQNTAQFTPGNYIIRAVFEGCGENQSGRGNQAVKVIIQ
jgi:hypothetical protein